MLGCDEEGIGYGRDEGQSFVIDIHVRKTSRMVWVGRRSVLFFSLRIKMLGHRISWGGQGLNLHSWIW